MLRAAIAFRDGGYGIPVLVGRDDVYDRLRALGRRGPAELRGLQQPQLSARAGDGRLPLPAAAAARLSAPRARADRQPGPQHLRLAAARAGRGRRDDHRRHPALCARPSARSAACSIPSRGSPRSASTSWSARATPCSSPTPRSPSGRPPSSSPRSRSRPPHVARRMGHEPRVAFLSYSNFGNPEGSYLERIRDAVKLLDAAATSTSNMKARCRPTSRSIRRCRSVYPFMRLTGPGQRAGHAGPADRQHLGQAAARARRRRGDRADAGRHGEAGPDRADVARPRRTW